MNNNKLRKHAAPKGMSIPQQTAVQALCGNWVKPYFLMSKRKRQHVDCKACISILEKLGEGIANGSPH